jgi:outer membrane immunogenic protein
LEAREPQTILAVHFSRPERLFQAELIMRIANLIALVGVAVGAIFRVSAAGAADLPTGTYNEPLPAVAAYNWTGCYLGGYVGGALQSREVNAWDPRSTGGAIPAGTYYDPNALPTPGQAFDNEDGNFNYDLKGSVIGGGTVGCNWQGASPLVVGIEGEGGYMKISGSSIVPYSKYTGFDSVSSTTIGDWNAALTGRVGYAWDRVLVYLKGGVGFSEIRSSFIDACSAAPCSPSLITATGSSQQPFWVAGAGVEYAFNREWSIKGEFLTLGLYKSFAVCGAGAGAAAGSTFCGKYNVEGVYAFKIGVNYYFNAPILAKY